MCTLRAFCHCYMDAWMRSNPGQCLTIYNILSVREAWPKASISTNIVKGFEVSGICPLNQEIFHDDDFAPAFVTYRQEVDTNNSASDEFKYKSDRYQTQNQDHSRLRVVKSVNVRHWLTHLKRKPSNGNSCRKPRKPRTMQWMAVNGRPSHLRRRQNLQSRLMLKNIIACFALSHIPTQGLEKLGLNVFSV